MNKKLCTTITKITTEGEVCRVTTQHDNKNQRQLSKPNIWYLKLEELNLRPIQILPHPLVPKPSPGPKFAIIYTKKVRIKLSNTMNSIIKKRKREKEKFQLFNPTEFKPCHLGSASHTTLIGSRESRPFKLALNPLTSPLVQYRSCKWSKPSCTHI